jgi:uncharacterized protein YcfL
MKPWWMIASLSVLLTACSPENSELNMSSQELAVFDANLKQMNDNAPTVMGALVVHEAKREDNMVSYKISWADKNADLNSIEKNFSNKTILVQTCAAMRPLFKQGLVFKYIYQLNNNTKEVLFSPDQCTKYNNL